MQCPYDAMRYSTFWNLGKPCTYFERWRTSWFVVYVVTIYKKSIGKVWSTYDQLGIRMITWCWGKAWVMTSSSFFFLCVFENHPPQPVPLLHEVRLAAVIWNTIHLVFSLELLTIENMLIWVKNMSRVDIVRASIAALTFLLSQWAS